MLVEEALDLLLVDIAHLLRGDSDDVPILVVARAGELVDVFFIGEVEVEDAEVLEVGCVDGAAGVVEFALVALGWRG
jgi:hypothetical protein